MVSGPIPVLDIANLIALVGIFATLLIFAVRMSRTFGRLEASVRSIENTLQNMRGRIRRLEEVELDDGKD